MNDGSRLCQKTKNTITSWRQTYAKEAAAKHWLSILLTHHKSNILTHRTQVRTQPSAALHSDPNRLLLQPAPRPTPECALPSLAIRVPLTHACTMIFLHSHDHPAAYFQHEPSPMNPMNHPPPFHLARNPQNTNNNPGLTTKLSRFNKTPPMSARSHCLYITSPITQSIRITSPTSPTTNLSRSRHLPRLDHLLRSLAVPRQLLPRFAGKLRLHQLHGQVVHDLPVHGHGDFRETERR